VKHVGSLPRLVIPNTVASHEKALPPLRSAHKTTERRRGLSHLSSYSKRGVRIRFASKGNPHAARCESRRAFRFRGKDCSRSRGGHFQPTRSCAVRVAHWHYQTPTVPLSAYRQESRASVACYNVQPIVTHIGRAAHATLVGQPQQSPRSVFRRFCESSSVYPGYPSHCAFPSRS